MIAQKGLMNMTSIKANPIINKNYDEFS